MEKIITRLILSAGLVALMLGGCGGSGTSGSKPGTSSAVSAGTVAKSVTGQSGQLITVNNVTFGTAGAAITLNGESASPADLKQGMQVTVTGSVDGATGTAAKIEIEGELEGMVEQVDTSAGMLTLLGQTALVTSQTVFDGVSGLGDISVGQKVEVYGLPDAAGIITATRVEVDASAAPPYLTGAISNLDSVTKTFSIRTITVDYAAAQLPAQALSNGLIVKVKGTYANGVMTASGIRARHVHPDHGHAEMEGLVADYDAAAGTFTLNGQKVQLTAATIYEHGAASEIINGVRVEVKGETQNGVLKVYKIEVDGDHGLPDPHPATPPTPVNPPTVVPPTPPVTPPAPVILPGQAIYDTNCKGCHQLGTYDTAGSAPNLSGKAGLISGKLSGGHMGTALGSQQITDLKAFVSTL